MEFLRFYFTQSKRSTVQNLLLEAFNQKRHLNIMKKYQQLGVEENSILFCSGKDVSRYHVNAITFLDHETMYVTFDSERIVAICSLTFNSVGIEANFSIVETCDESWLKISEIEIMNKQLIFSHNGGVSLRDLESNAVSQILSAQFLPKYLAAYKDGFLFTSKHCMYFWKTSVMELLAGQAAEEGSRDGSASYFRFYEATGIAVEFDNVVYVCDRSVGSIKIIAELKETAKFLGGLQSIINAFSVHEKHRSYSLKTLDEAISLVSYCDEMLSRNVEIIKSVNGDGLPNGFCSNRMLHKNAAMRFKEA